MVEEKKTEENKEEVKEVVKEEVAKIPVTEDIGRIKAETALEKWVPTTSIGKRVFSGEITDFDEVLKSGKEIKEHEIVDKLVPNIKNELILIGGRAGKGGGIQRIPVKITASMHKSGRRFTISAFVAVGNEDGLVGVGRGTALEARDAIEKSIRKAKLKLIRIKRGCGSWECGCGEQHSIPYKTKGKSGSVRVEMNPAPKGVGLVADSESRKILRLAGIKDVWIRTYGNTSTRINLISAIYDALKKLYIFERENE